MGLTAHFSFFNIGPRGPISMPVRDLFVFLVADFIFPCAGPLGPWGNKNHRVLDFEAQY